jgi:hypothetical protein
MAASKKNLSKLERMPLREAWKHEAGEFTPWLAEEGNLQTLADALGLAELELVARFYFYGLNLPIFGPEERLQSLLRICFKSI